MYTAMGFRDLGVTVNGATVMLPALYSSDAWLCPSADEGKRRMLAIFIFQTNQVQSSYAYFANGWGKTTLNSTPSYERDYSMRPKRIGYKHPTKGGVLPLFGDRVEFKEIFYNG